MKRELERKFLVQKVPPDLEQHPHRMIDQGYLALEPDGIEVRLRKKGDAYLLTVKRGRGSAARRPGISRTAR